MNKRVPMCIRLLNKKKKNKQLSWTWKVPAYRTQIFKAHD